MGSYVKVGSGDIASALPRRDDLLFFASGVSNSREVRMSEYQREVDLLLEQRRDLQLVYFSSLAIFYSDTPYTQHKRYMEVLIKDNFPNHTIVRLGNIDFGTNPHTLINYLRMNPDAELRDEYRFVINKDEFLYWVSLIPDFPCEMNCPGRRMKVKEIYEEYVRPYNTVL